MGEGFALHPLEDARFGLELRLADSSIQNILSLFTKHRQLLLDAYYSAHGLLVIRGIEGIREQPDALVELSHHFGEEVENYRQTLTSPRFFHDSVPEILILSNSPPCNHPPPALPRDYTPGAEPLPVDFPTQRNWHTDQSYRRPPPDSSLLLALDVPPSEQGQTLYADCTAAYAALDASLKERLHHLEGIHAPSWVGRSRTAVEAGEPPLDLLDHQQPQRHPLVRCHPVTGELSLYICEEDQMDYVDGPITSLGRGLDCEGAALIHQLLRHATRPEFVYVHEWQNGDLVIGDNRNLLHCATWFDADRYSRLMWRTTVMGNPGVEYQGEAKSWLPRDDTPIMQGMENA